MTTNDPIVGGMFGRENDTILEQSSSQFLEGKHLKLYNARSGLHIICQLLKPQQIWIPAYVCGVLLDAVPAGLNIRFYPVSGDLRVTDTQWVDELNSTDLVVFIDYFGFNFHDSVIASAKKKGAWILQDAAQALLSTFERPYADYIIYSPRKFIGVPDGGILETKTSPCPSEDLLTPPSEELDRIAMKAFNGRTAFDYCGKGDWFNDFKKAEKLQRSGQFCMSKTTQHILSQGFNYIEIKELRRNNFLRLLNELHDISLIKTIRPDEVPLGFPVVVENRDKVRTSLIDEKIYCPIHWDTMGIIPDSFSTSHSLSKHILTLICDQRTTEQQLKKMIKTVRKHL